MPQNEALYRYTISRARESARLIRKEFIKIATKVAEDTINKYKVYVTQYWYDAHTPMDYDRTYSYLKCIKYKIENNSVIVYFDDSELDRISPQQTGGWGAHEGFDGQAFPNSVVTFDEDMFMNGLVEFVEKGTVGTNFNAIGTLPDIRGSGALEKTLKWLNTKVNNDVFNGLRLKFGDMIVKG